MNKPVTSTSIKAMKGKQKIAILTAYDYTSALLLDRAGLDVILVGDSLGMVMLGRKDTLAVTIDEMILHCRSVVAGVERAFVVADMPFMSYEPGVETALKNAARLVQEGGVRAVKLEGPYLAEVKALTSAGIPVMGHIGLTPQRAAELGGFKVQGKTSAAAQALIDEAVKLEQAGCFSLVLECIPAQIAEIITKRLNIPTIGIGAGPHCDGQVLVMHDILGLFDRFVPRFVKRYAELGQEIQKGAEAYCAEVRDGVFPGPEHSFSIDEHELKEVK